jgi:Tfp pilus assembly protein PilX
VALIAVLCCLMVAGVVVLNMLRSSIIEQRQLRAQRQHLQAERLAEAGLERAVAQLRQSSTYAGETWLIAAAELVEPINDRPQERTILVQADYPDDPLHRVRKTREASVTLSQ